MPDTPIMTKAQGTSRYAIWVEWTYSGSLTNFQIERVKDSDQTTTYLTAVSSFPTGSFFDSGLERYTQYNYRVRALDNNGNPGSFWSGTLGGYTLDFDTTFNWLDGGPGRTVNEEAGWEGYSLVQRIEADRLTQSGTQVRIWLLCSSVSDAQVNFIYISQPDPTPGADPYDSLTYGVPGGLRKVYEKAYLRKNGGYVILPAVDYNLDHTRPLLIAADFSPLPPATIKYVDPEPIDQARAYWQVYNPATHAGAQWPDRPPGYAPLGPPPGIGRIYLVAQIDVG